MLLILLLFGVMFLLMFIGLDIFISMGIASVTYLLASGNAPLTLIANSMINGISSTSLLAIPFFILVGELMNRSGMTLRVVNFARFFIGKFKGGLSYSCVIVNIICAGVSGSAPADCSAVSSVMLPAMNEEKYPADFSAAVNASAAVIGPIIPPSIPMIFIAMITNLSVGRLFLGGLIPGLIMGIAMMVICYFRVRKMDLREYHGKKTWGGFWKVLKESYLSLIAPIIILVGVLTGLVTVTEVSILATAYVLIIGVFVYKTIKFKDLLGIFKKTAGFSSTIMALFSIVGIFSWFIAVEEIGKTLGAFVTSMNLSPFVFLLLINLLFVIVGCVMDAIPAMLIFVPVLLPIAINLGIDPIHFGVVVVANLMIGLLTPPVGALLFLEAKLARVSFNKLTRAVSPFIVALYVVLILMTYVPAIVTYLPNLLF